MHNKQQQYQNLVSGTVELDSHLHGKLTDHLNAEIVLNTIIDLDKSLMEWLQTTFWYIRTTSQQIAQTQPPIDQDLIKKNIAEKSKGNFIYFKY